MATHKQVIVPRPRVGYMGNSERFIKLRQALKLRKHALNMRAYHNRNYFKGYPKTLELRAFWNKVIDDCNSSIRHLHVKTWRTLRV